MFEMQRKIGQRFRSACVRAGHSNLIILRYRTWVPIHHSVLFTCCRCLTKQRLWCYRYQHDFVLCRVIHLFSFDNIIVNSANMLRDLPLETSGPLKELSRRSVIVLRTYVLGGYDNDNIGYWKRLRINKSWLVSDSEEIPTWKHKS